MDLPAGEPTHWKAGPRRHFGLSPAGSRVGKDPATRRSPAAPTPDLAPGWGPGCSDPGPDPDPELMEPIQPSVSVSPHGRFERLQEDPNYISHFTRAPGHKGQRRLHCFLLRYLLAGVGLFVLGLLIGWFTHTPTIKRPVPPSDSSDLLEELLRGITADKIDALQSDLVAEQQADPSLKDLFQRVRPEGGTAGQRLCGYFLQDSLLVLKQLRVQHNRSSAYHAQSQGALERFHQTLKSLLRAYCTELDKDWEEGLPWLMLAAREVTQESTGSFKLYVDASYVGAGAVLMQSDDLGIDKPPLKLLPKYRLLRWELLARDAGLLGKPTSPPLIIVLSKVVEFDFSCEAVLLPIQRQAKSNFEECRSQNITPSLLVLQTALWIIVNLNEMKKELDK
ncbi:hypothetical protein L3Q82_007836 [Scortum barcoo]|uniref:Uncharacterized protein n=1 Tax=Scortum barcoo TaxID=214431 RepID=A0ACB8WJX9_9TELE|nr:hypothetical protein L3Q82_007836 [Scortum barcoo]